MDKLLLILFTAHQQKRNTKEISSDLIITIQTKKLNMTNMICITSTLKLLLVGLEHVKSYISLILDV